MARHVIRHNLMYKNNIHHPTENYIFIKCNSYIIADRGLWSIIKRKRYLAFDIEHYSLCGKQGRKRLCKHSKS